MLVCGRAGQQAHFGDCCDMMAYGGGSANAAQASSMARKSPAYRFGPRIGCGEALAGLLPHQRPAYCAVTRWPLRFHLPTLNASDRGAACAAVDPSERIDQLARRDSATRDMGTDRCPIDVEAVEPNSNWPEFEISVHSRSIVSRPYSSPRPSIGRCCFEFYSHAHTLYTC